MCGFIFLKQSNSFKVSRNSFKRAVNAQLWRGPDAMKVEAYQEGQVLMGHNRLAVIDPVPRSDQPMESHDGRFVIIYNGEIYNHREIKRTLNIDCVTNSDTEIILEGYAKLGKDIVNLLDGMFAFVIYDKSENTWFSARDFMGIKPMYYYEDSEVTVIGSEPAPIAEMLSLTLDSDSIKEWRLARRPVPGNTYFRNLKEHLPGTWRDSNHNSRKYWKLSDVQSSGFEQSEFEYLLRNSVSMHEMSDVTNVSLLSGGLDSAVITGLSNTNRSYCVGLPDNNEFSGAYESAKVLGRELMTKTVSNTQLEETWRTLAKKRGEPLSVPNEALIYLICKDMEEDEKVVLTGEGADEILFGYDRIFRWSLEEDWKGTSDFLKKYGYSGAQNLTDRMKEYIEAIRFGKTQNEFVEDFFLDFHLPGLLRRMDFSAMAASKEARVPFVSKALVSYLYRANPSEKIDRAQSKIPLRKMAKSMRLFGALSRQKIGFSASSGKLMSRAKEYEKFQNIVMEELAWS